MTPTFTTQAARHIAATHFGLNGHATPLVSYDDQNFRLDATDGSVWVLKIAAAGTPAETLDFQNQTLVHLEARHAHLGCPRIWPTHTGALMQSVEAPGGQGHWVRIFSFLEGTFWGAAGPHTPAARRALGAFFGELDAGLHRITHPAMSVPHPWDLKHAAAVRPRTTFIEAPGRRALVERCFDGYLADVAPRLADLRHQVIHGDGNEHNVLVDTEAPDRIAGVIDFGDLTYTCTVCEPAILAAYGALGTPDPLAAATEIVAGYHAQWPLTPGEVALLYPLMTIRLCMSVTQAAYSRHEDPDNTYRQSTAGLAWAALEHLAEVEPAHATDRFHSALHPAA